MFSDPQLNASRVQLLIDTSEVQSSAFDSNNVHALLSELKCMINSNEAYVNDSLESKPNQVAD